MPEPNESVRPAQRRSLLKRLRHIGTILLILLSGYYAIKDVVEVVHEMRAEARKDADGEAAKPDEHSFSERLKALVASQVAQLDRVDPMSLKDTYIGSLEQNNCSWFVDCRPVERRGVDVRIGTLDLGMNTIVERPTLVVRLGPIPIPTWHTISGAPLATLQSVRMVAHSGYWAIAMFLSCAIIWFVILLSFARQDSAMAAYMMFIGAPIGISCMVWCVQKLSEGALHLFGLLGCAVALSLAGLLHSTALALVVGFRHIVLTRKELAEETEKLRAG